MKFRQFVAGTLVFVWLCQDSAMARQKTPLPPPSRGPITWGELSKFIVDRKIEAKLSDRTKLQGDVLAVRPDSLVLDITKSSNRKAYPVGQTAIPRTSVADLKFIRVGGPGRLIGGIVGAVGGAFTAGAMAWYLYPAGLIVGPFVVLPIMAVTGYYAGKAADRRRRQIILAPDPVAAAEVPQEVESCDQENQ
jgi:hypothetical protein